jgi:hypothetical protein
VTHIPCFMTIMVNPDVHPHGLPVKKKRDRQTGEWVMRNSRCWSNSSSSYFPNFLMLKPIKSPMFYWSNPWVFPTVPPWSPHSMQPLVPHYIDPTCSLTQENGVPNELSIFDCPYSNLPH